jgi:four helix bundle protein
MCLKDFDNQTSFVYKVADNAGEYKTYKECTTLECWKLARKVKLFFYREVIPCLPKEEMYDLGSQIRNASVSTTANIAEGYGRFHYKESIQFYRISRGSMFELKDHLITCYDLKYSTLSTYKKGAKEIESVIKKLNGYISYINKLVRQ